MSWLLSASIVWTLGAAPPAVKQIHEGRHWVWYAQEDQFAAHQAEIEGYYDYADQAFDYLCGAWGLKPPAEKYALLVWPRTGGGFAAGNIGEVSGITGKQSPGIGVSWDCFVNTANGIKGYWGWAILTHEMVNLFTGQVVSGGWPVDWWADHLSPFPMLTAVNIEYALKPEVAVFHARQLSGPIEKMFVALKDQYGWAMFRQAFQTAIADGVDWSRLGPNPGPVLTNYVCAYLQLGAPEPLHELLKPVPGYDANQVADILAARARWLALPEGDARRTELREAYLHRR